MNKRLYVERKPAFRIEQESYIETFKELFNIEVKSLRYALVYDLFHISPYLYEIAKNEVLIEKNRDDAYESFPFLRHTIATEPLPGQFDMRSEAAMQCLQLYQYEKEVVITSSFLITFDEELSPAQIDILKHYLINKVESREKDMSVLSLPEEIIPNYQEKIIHLCEMNDHMLQEFHRLAGLAMTFQDLQFVKEYFESNAKRNPFETEIKVLDTYWSDHCRHTTFETILDDIRIEDGWLKEELERTYLDYKKINQNYNQDKPTTLMNLAKINAIYESKQNRLTDLEISDETNACSIEIDVDHGNENEKWLLMYKNETHNHPTEIEPYGGASTCIGGAIRDPLSGRSFVYGAMRITGAADINQPFENTLPGKLPQRVISTLAAKGYSSYGNQIGLPTTYVKEIFHPGFVAKRMEVGAVIGACKKDHVVRLNPTPGDIILLIGGRTGRDGIGGATGSSKIHNQTSLRESSSEVQKGNALEERKLQRLFRNPVVSKLIKKANDFGAGGVSVAVGELSDGMIIYLDQVPTKYLGLLGYELAISESQERMAVVIDRFNLSLFQEKCKEENVEVSQIGLITSSNRLQMMFKGEMICDLDRDFLNTNGVMRTQSVILSSPKTKRPTPQFIYHPSLSKTVQELLKHENIASLQGLDEMFDVSIGKTTVLAPYGGKYRLTKTHTSVHKIPVEDGLTQTISMMSYGYDPYLSSWSPYHGAMYAVIDSIAKILASGGDYHRLHFSFQEYFERLGEDPLKWGKPMMSLLGAYQCLRHFELASIGGKDSMSGSFMDLHVPPTLISFAVAVSKIDQVISPELKGENHYLYLLDYHQFDNLIPDFEDLKNQYDYFLSLLNQKIILSASPIGQGGLLEAIIKSSFGNKIGCDISIGPKSIEPKYGAILFESSTKIDDERLLLIGQTKSTPYIMINQTPFLIDELIRTNRVKYEKIYPLFHATKQPRWLDPSMKILPKKHFTHPKKKDNVEVLIPVFPGTNSEYDTSLSFERAGGKATIFVFKNQSDEDIHESIETFRTLINQSDIICFSGGFSSGDEPDGSGKFIASVLQNPKIKDAIHAFLDRKNLILGICNGFQALVKSGLLPFGKIMPLSEDSPTLFKNDIGRHVAKFVDTRVTSLSSPWLSSFSYGMVHTIPISHGEGKLVLSEKLYHELKKNHQIAFQYVDEFGNPSLDERYNPNGSDYAIEGLLSPNGLILGKMGHSERYITGTYQNISGNLDQNIFQNAIDYFIQGGNDGTTI